jgi:hypothetical protein
MLAVPRTVGAVTRRCRHRNWLLCSEELVLTSVSSCPYTTTSESDVANRKKKQRIIRDGMVLAQSAETAQRLGGTLMLYHNDSGSTKPPLIQAPTRYSVRGSGIIEVPPRCQAAM